MPITLVKKRSGSIAQFDSSRITHAIKMAYLDEKKPISDIELETMKNQVVFELEYKYDTEETNPFATAPNIEEIQDIVERIIAQKGDFDVAKSFILYRAKRAALRAQKQAEMLDRVDKSEISVKKRSGKIVPFDISQIEIAIKNVASSYEPGLIPVDRVVAGAKLNIYDMMTTSEINKAIVLAMKPYIERDPKFSFVAARFLVNDLYKEVIGTDEYAGHFAMMYEKKFPEVIKSGVADKRYDVRLSSVFDLERLAKELKPARDNLFEFMGLQVLYDRYFIKTSEQKFLETPQYFWMRIAMGLAILEADPNQAAIDFYNMMSTLRYSPSTPTLLHSGTVHAQMSSCYLTTIQDDLNDIFKSFSDNAQMAKYSGGVANDWTNIRATNAMVKKINTPSQGVIPFLKIVDATTASINRSGKRRGATVVYLETWHLDIEEFLDLRKNTGDERRRTHDTNTANWIPDLFMKRVQENADWTLLSPDEAPDLHDLYGKKFEEAYVGYEKKAAEGKIALYKTVKASDLWRKMLMMLFETGHPWITFKDPFNIRSPQDHVGVIHSTNLCTEIGLNTSKDETAVCNLGSVNLPVHFVDGKLDGNMMAETIKLGMRMLDNVIDLNFYPTIEGKNSNLRHRPVGIDIIGLQDSLYKMDLAFDSDAAVKFSDEVMEFVGWHAIYNSAMLAKERGAYQSFKGSKWDRGLFPVDTIKLLEDERGIPTGINPVGKMDWKEVRDAVRQYGMRNSNTMAIAPTATRSNICGVNPSIEPTYKNLFVKSNFSGEFTCLNEPLIYDLQKLGLWNDTMLEKIKQLDGNISTIHEIPETIRNKYKEAFQIDPYWVILHAAVRGKWIDQSQSINIFLNTTSGRVISDTYMQAWKMGLKSTYYLRSMGATSIEKTTTAMKAQDVPVNAPKIEVSQVAAPVIAEAVPIPSAEAVTKSDFVLERPKVMVAGETCESCA